MSVELEEIFEPKQDGLWVNKVLKDHYPTVFFDSFIDENDTLRYVTVLKFSDYVVQLHMGKSSDDADSIKFEIFATDMEKDITRHYDTCPGVVLEPVAEA